ncbi:MAG: immunity protein Tsi6 family protein [Thiomicrorhabdus sp.]|nr:immunity protein Tsi6 family protein [Thiomicrorhabdus sp.]
MKIDEAQLLVEEAIKKSYQDFSEDTTWQPVISTRTQLNYILDALYNRNDRSKLKDIIIGIIAVREFEANYEDFSNMIYKVVEIVDLIKKGRI